MRTTRGLGASLIAAVSLVVAGMSPALAEPPANDDVGAALALAAPPSSHSAVTTEATRAADDPACAGSDENTVLYSFTAPESIRTEINTFGSDYDTTLSVYTGTRGALTQVACNDDTSSLQSRVRFDAVAGERYLVMIGSYTAGGGNLSVSLDVAPAPYQLGATIAGVGSVNLRTGVATIRGTVSCNQPGLVELSGRVRQRAGRVFVTGFFSSFPECSGETAWEATVESDDGPFVAGSVQVNAVAWGCVIDECAEATASKTVRLRAGG
jgi:hypothetical protein